MSAVGLVPLLEAVVERLRATEAFTSRCSLFSKVPQQQTYPYARIEDPYETPDRTFGQGGHRGVFHVTIFTNDGSPAKRGSGTTGPKPGLEIAAIIITAI